jgi:hypothetical protein
VAYLKRVSLYGQQQDRQAFSAAPGMHDVHPWAAERRWPRRWHIRSIGAFTGRLTVNGQDLHATTYVKAGSQN